MKNTKLLLLCILSLVLMLFPEIASAQQIYPAAGSLESAEDGLWNYYRGKTKTTVKRNAPMYEKLTDANHYLLDYTKIRGVELYLTAEFRNNHLTLLQILTPFPEYTTCNKETKDISRSFAEVGNALMGVEFTKKECTTSKDNGGTYVCAKDDYACVYRLCPDNMWAFACSVIE